MTERGGDSPPGEERLRLFIAVELPAAWHDALAAQQAALRGRLGTVVQALHWVRPESLHVTLVFLGETPAAEEPRIREALTRAAAGTRPFVLRLGRPGTFGGRRPRVVWTGIEGDVAALSRLHERLVAELGVAEEEARRFAPHITLARVADRPRSRAGHDGEAVSALQAALAHTPAIAAPPLDVHAVSLMQSELQRGGAVYTRRFAAAL